MYIPSHFNVTDVATLHALIHERPLATLVTQGSEGLHANHIPFVLEAGAQPDQPLGVLRGHVARANPLWRDCIPDAGVLAVFHGPEAYISPSWYATKGDTGRVVPTWNYATVHAHGRLRVIEDAAWLRAQLEALTAHNERRFAAPWRVADAPRDYTDGLVKAIVGIEILIVRLEGKWKVSQNQPQQNIASVVDALRADGSDDMAQLVALRASRP